MGSDTAKKQKSGLEEEKNGALIYGELVLSVGKLQVVQDELEKIFKFLNNLQVENSKEVKSGYSITFEFNPNPYFEVSHPSKTFIFLEEGVTKITATPIKWNEGMGIPNGVAEDKKGKKRSHSEESFFTWFSESEHKKHIYVADIIKEDMWPNPIRYLNNNSNDKDEVEVEDYEDEENGDSSGDDGDDTEEDDEEDGN